MRRHRSVTRITSERTEDDPTQPGIAPSPSSCQDGSASPLNPPAFYRLSVEGYVCAARDTGRVPGALPAAAAIGRPIGESVPRVLAGVLKAGILRAARWPDHTTRAIVLPIDGCHTCEVHLSGNVDDGFVALVQVSDTDEPLPSACIRLQDLENKRMADRLHRQVGSNLSALAMMSRLLTRHVDKEKPIDAADVQNLALLASETAIDVESIVHALHPVVLENDGLSAALRNLALETDDRTSLTCDFALVDPVIEPPTDMARALYRIAEECIENAARHADATHIRIRLNTISGKTGCLSIRDDGTGLPNDLSIGLGTGLDLARRYARLKGAGLIVHTAPGTGSTVLCRFPIGTNQASRTYPDPVAA